MRTVMIKTKTCTACKNMLKMIESSGKTVDLEVLDAYENAQLCLDNDISTVPTFLKIDDRGQVVDKVSGTMSVDDLIQFAS